MKAEQADANADARLRRLESLQRDIDAEMAQMAHRIDLLRARIERLEHACRDHKIAPHTPVVADARDAADLAYPPPKPGEP